MRFYKNQHEYYCGIDLHAHKMYVCVVNYAGEVLLHKNIDTDGEQFLEVISPYRENIVLESSVCFPDTELQTYAEITEFHLF